MVELLTAMAVMLVVVAAILGIWLGLQRTYTFASDDLRAQEEARLALNEMVELIRTARQPSDPPSPELNLVIVSAGKNALVFWSDVDRDSKHALELVRFRVDSDTRTLYRDTNTSGDLSFVDSNSVRLVANWVSNDDDTPLFAYVDQNGSELERPVSDPTLIRQVVINLLIDVYQGEAPVTHHLKTVVQPRNLR